MLIGRLVGWLLLMLGLVVLGRDLLAWRDTHVFAPVVAGQLWYEIDRASLNLVQAVIQRYVAPWLWDPVITSLLFLWASALFAVPGLALLWLCRKRDNGSRPRRRSK